ncbi:MAG: PQQ-binding-like beta-propeller repeat protein, partial [Actinobacteria bacterium]|nr:PQQ-binding-like beta-propeller repeat protein [Actinomycetota bacterium]
LITAPAPAPSVGLQTPSASLQSAWTTGERAALGTPFRDGTVVTFSTHSVHGRNARTGATTWSYTRTNRTLCQVIQDQGFTVAMFELNGNCDQVTALDSTTGVRRWTRTLDEDGAPLNGYPTYSVTADTIMLTTAQVIYAIDPISGLDRWVYQPTRCAITNAVLGSGGALISQRCTAPPCDGLDFCGSGPQLLLRDASAAHTDDQSHKANPDRIKWNRIGNTAVPMSADQILTAVDRTTNKLEILAPRDGSVRATLPVRAGPPDTPVAQVATSQAELLWIDGVTYALGLSDDRLLWTRPTRGAPTSVTSSALITAVGVDGLVLLDPSTGKTTRLFPEAAPFTTGARAYEFGSGFIVAESATTVYR